MSMMLMKHFELSLMLNIRLVWVPGIEVILYNLYSITSHDHLEFQKRSLMNYQEGPAGYDPIYASLLQKRMGPLAHLSGHRMVLKL